MEFTGNIIGYASSVVIDFLHHSSPYLHLSCDSGQIIFVLSLIQTYHGGYLC
jgi:hypothetical protein